VAADLDPTTLGYMRANVMRSLDVSCWQCHHRAILSERATSGLAAGLVIEPRGPLLRCMSPVSDID
jgi:hypothetical protein